MDDALFPIPDGARVEKADSPRTLAERQMAKMRRGLHPLSMPGRLVIRLHKDAPPPEDLRAPGPRCGSCRFRQLVQAENWRTYPKCAKPGRSSILTHSNATDVKNWFPACHEYEPKPDGA